MMIMTQSKHTIVNFDNCNRICIERDVPNDVFYISAEIRSPSYGFEILGFYGDVYDAEAALLELQAAIKSREKVFLMPVGSTPLTGRAAEFARGELLTME